MTPPPAADTTPPDTANVATVAAGALGLAVTVAALAMFGVRTALSVGLGASVAVGNLVAMRAIVRALLRGAEAEASAEAARAEAEGEAAAKAAADTDGNANAGGSGAASTEAEADAEPEAPRDHSAEGRRGGAAWGGFAVVKIVVLFGGIWLLMTRGLVDPLPLVVGYGVLPLGIAASSVFSSLAPRPRRPARRSGRKA